MQKENFLRDFVKNGSILTFLPFLTSINSNELLKDCWILKECNTE